MTPAPALLSRSVFLAGPDAALQLFCAHFDIAPEHCFFPHRPDTFDHLSRRQNALEGAPCGGDFDALFDLSLWGHTVDSLARGFDHLSTLGMSLATDLDDDQHTPFASTLFYKGQRFKVDILEDDPSPDPANTPLPKRRWLHYAA